MCSLTESELEPELVKIPLDLNTPQICKKCKEIPPCVNLRGNDTYCKTCFLTAVHHKFRSTLGKNKAMRPGDLVCVAYSGGTASTSLVHLLKTGIESDHKKLLFKPIVLHVDEGSVFNLDPAKRLENIREKCNYITDFAFKVYVSALEQPTRVVEYKQGEDLDFQFEAEKSNELYEAIQNIKEASARQEFVNNIRRQAIVQGAQMLNVAKVFTAENATKISIDLLAGVSLGKGGNLANESGFRDLRNDDVMVLRPLRDVPGKELALYAQYHRLNSFTDTVLGTGQDSLFSIRKLTEDFLVGLQNDFPATLSTVFKTSDKLQVQEDRTNVTKCILCSGGVDTCAEEHNALQATMWSTIVSGKGKTLDTGNQLISNNLNTLDITSLSLEDKKTGCESSKMNQADTECCGQGDGSCKTNKSEPLTKAEVLTSVCYACMRTVNSFRDVNKLPANFHQQVQYAKNRNAMKNEIQEFLL